jgi:hypothetical protein
VDQDKTKFEAVDILRKFDIPCAPGAVDEGTRRRAVAARQRHHRRSRPQGARQYFTVGSPIKFSDSSSPRSPLRRCWASTPTKCWPSWATEGPDRQPARSQAVTKYGADVLRVPALHKDGHTLSIAFTVSMLFAPDQKVSGIVAIVRDETARFAEERKLRARLVEVEAATNK